MRKFLKIIQTCIFVCLLLGLAFGTFYSRFQFISLDKVISPLIQAEIKGEINSPGVYTLKRGSTLKTLLKEAQGATEEADLSSLSLLEEIEDQDLVIIPPKKEKDPLISINTASLEQLITLKGVGPSTAQKIIDYRNQKPFQTLEDLMEVKGIGPALFEKVKDKICL